MDDLISRQAAIDVPEKFIKDCNPEHFVGNQKFIEYMDDAEISSFGNWQFANGFNMGLTAAEVAIKKLPSAQPIATVKHGKWIWEKHIEEYICSECGRITQDTHDEPIEWEGHKGFALKLPYWCGYCGAKMEGSEE